MKKILFSYTNFLVLVGLLIGCADETTHPWNGLVQEAATVIVDEVVVPVYDVTNLGSAKYEVKLSSPTNNISKYDISVSLNDGDTVFVKSITSFPATLSVTAQEIATALQMNLEDLAPGDKVSFLADVTRTDGTVFGVEDLDGDVNNPGMKQGYWFTTFVSCPFVPADAAGTYAVVNDDFEGSWDPSLPVEVVAGPGANQITIVDVFKFSEVDPAFKGDLIVNVNPVTGQASTTTQTTWIPQAWGLPASYGKGYVTGNDGFVFSCSGTITLNFTWTVDAGSFGGGYNFTLEKL